MPLSTDADAPSRRPRISLLFFAIAFLLVFARSMFAALEVDEHSFIATGALLARRSLLPYRDYHYNHMPMLILVYSGLFRLTDHLLLAARAWSALCASLTALVIFRLAYQAFQSCLPGRRTFFAFALGMPFLTHSLFTQTAVPAW